MIILEIILLLYFSYVSLYSFVLAIAGLFYKMPVFIHTHRKAKIVVLIPSYKEDNVIAEAAQDALLQRYDKAYFDVVVIADSLKPETIERLKTLPVILIEVSFDKSTKVKSLNRAMAAIGDDYDYALILDADNIMEKNFLSKMNDLLQQGHRAIQGERTSKNQTSQMSVLDGISEAINNYIYRQGTYAIGFSSALIGSGMIFEYRLLKEILAGFNSIGGFDRELEVHLIARGIRIYYAKGVVVYDEKVETTEVFERQRTRWLSSQFIYLIKFFRKGWSELFKGNLSLFNSAILKNIQLPRVLNLGLLIILSVVSYLVKDYLYFGYLPWLTALLLISVSLAIAIPRSLYNRQLLKSIWLLPKVFIKMFNLLFKLKGANKSFIHTPHGFTVKEKKDVVM